MFLVSARLSTWGRHVRAALLLSGRSPDDLAVELNISRKTLERTIRGERQPKDWETTRAAELLDVPAWFITDGLGGADEDDGGEREELSLLRLIAGKVDGLETGLAADIARMRQLLEQLTRA